MSNNHITYEDRVKIENFLNHHVSINRIALELGFNPSSISREIERNRTFFQPNMYQQVKCAKALNCPKHVVPKPCSINCQYYVPAKCKYQQNIVNGVCNGCFGIKGRPCYYEHFTYRAKDAQLAAEDRRTKAYANYRILDYDFIEINKIVSDYMSRGFSLYAIHHMFPNKINVSLSTLRNWLIKGYFNVDYLDSRRPQFKYPKKPKKPCSSRDKAIIHGRTYQDFQNYFKPSNTILTEVDTVTGKQNDIKSILTIEWPEYRFQIGILLEQRTSRNVNLAFAKIRHTLGHDLYAKMFQTILTDNGAEFNNLPDIETDLETGELVSRVFYCDPYASNQKGACERNHVYIRYVFPKGVSFENLTQEKVDLLFSNINSMERPSLKYNTPCFVFAKKFGEKAMALLNIRRIPNSEINLTPSLFN